MIRLVQDTILPYTILVLRDDDECTPAVRDLTGVEVRGYFGRLLEVSTKNCKRVLERPTSSIFYRILELDEVDLIPTEAVETSGETISVVPTAQPVSPQRLQLDINNLIAGASVEIHGTDPEGAVFVETISVNADGVYPTEGVFASITRVDVADPGDMDVRVFVHDGRVRVKWVAGDLALTGYHRMDLELIPDTEFPDERQMLGEPILVYVRERSPLPVPVVVSMDPVSGDPSDAILVVGSGFLDASLVFLESAVDGTKTSANFSVTSDTQLTLVVPALDPGQYRAVVQNIHHTSAPGPLFEVLDTP